MATIAFVILITLVIAIAVFASNAVRNYCAREEAIDAKVEYWEGIIAVR